MTEGLAFLHNDVKMVHGNVCPQSIVINKSGAWKIAGFDFNILNANVGEQAVGLPGPFSTATSRIICFPLPPELKLS